MTPGSGKYSSMDDMSSPKVIESPGGGIGVELSLLPMPGGSRLPSSSSPGGVAHAPPPPPPLSTPMTRRGSPALTSREGYGAAENVAFFASLWEQCRAVASILNAKLLRSAAAAAAAAVAATTPSSAAHDGVGKLGAELERQWRRHRCTFVSKPQGVPDFRFDRDDDDDFFGPSSRRHAYVIGELLTYARIAEERWSSALSSMVAAAAVAADGAPLDATTKSAGIPFASLSHHQAGAPWMAYRELSEAVLGLGRAVLHQSWERQQSNNRPSSSSVLSRRPKFVGSIDRGDSGVSFEDESRRDHKGENGGPNSYFTFLVLFANFPSPMFCSHCLGLCVARA